MSGTVVDVVSRLSFLFAVEKALPKLKEAEDRAAVWAWAQKADKVCAGAWNIDGCRCPVSAVGIDRLREDAQQFASEFDHWMEVDPDDPVIFNVFTATTKNLGSDASA